MIGVIVANKAQTFNEAVFHELRAATIIEHTIDNALKAEQAQKVIVAVPASQRRKIKGAGIYKPLVRGDRSYLGRRAIFDFYSNKEDFMGGIYFSALAHGLDHIVLIDTTCPLIPAWLLNNMIFEYMSKTNRNVFMYNSIEGEESEFYDPAFSITIFPFWMLADRFLYADDRSKLDFISIDAYEKYAFTNEGESFLPKCKQDLQFTDLTKLETFDFLIEELGKGADLGGLIEELNES